MAASDLTEEIRKRRVADALNGLSSDQDPDPDTDASDSADVSTTDTEGRPRSLGFTFTPISSSAEDVPQNVPRGTFLGEEGADVSPALTAQKVYSTPPEQGEQQYVIDQDTGQKIPRAQLATSEDIAAQPPPSGAEMQRVTVEGQVPRATLVDPDPDEQYFSNPDLANRVKRAQLVDPDPDNLYLPPGSEGDSDAQKAALVGRAIKRAALVDPDPDQQYLAATQELDQPPKAQPSLGFTFTPVTPGNIPTAPVKPAEPTAPVKPAEPVAQQAPGFADRAQQWQTAMRAYGFDARINPDGSWVGIDAQGKEATPEQNKALYQFGAMLSKQYGFSGQEQKLDQLQDVTAPAVKKAEPVTQPQGGDTKEQPAQQVDTSTFKNPDGSEFPQRVQAVGGKNPVAFIMHHTGDRHTVQGVIDSLKERGLGVEYVADRDGTIYQIGNSGAQNILPGWGPKGTGLNNSNIVGMEVIAKDNNDVTQAQKDSIARFMAARYPSTPIFGHGEVNPGHKEADEGLSAKNAALAYRAGAPGIEVAAPQAQPVTKQANGLYQNEKPEDFLTGKMTTFATPEDLASGADNGVGAPRLGRLDTTSVAGVAIPEAALRAKYGNNYVAWRTARVDVVDQQTGKRLRVPIVDLGPRGDLSAIADMTPTLANYFGGDKNLSVKLVDNAGPDVNKNPQLFADEQAAIKQGFDSSTLQAGVQRIVHPQGYKFTPVAPDQQKTLTDQFAQAERKSLSDLKDQYGNSPVGLFKRLDQPVKGVSDSMRQEFQSNLKAGITKYAQDFYNEPDPNKAFQKATGDANFGTVAGDVIKKVGPYFNQAVTAFNQSAAVIDQNRLDDLAKAVHPQASADARKTFINSIISEPDPAARAAHINAIIGQLAQENPNNPALAALRATDIADSAARLANPEYQKRQKDEIDRQVAQNMRDLRPDPRLQGTPAGWWVDQLAQLPKNIVEGITGPVGDSLLISEIYQGTMERLRQENPGMSEDELKAKIGGSSATQVIAMMTLNRLSGGKLGTMVGQIENPAVRIGLSALMHTGIGGTIGAAQQVVTNIAENKPRLAGVLESAAAGAVQALPGAVISGLHGPARPTEEPVRAEPKPEALPGTLPVTEERPSTEQPVRPTPQPPGPEQAPPAGPVTQEDVQRRAYELYEERTSNGQPGTALDDWNRAQAELNRTSEPILPGTMSEAEPITSAIANRYVQERMAAGELGQIDPSQGKSTEDMMRQGLQMSPMQRDGLIDNFMKAKGGDLDQQGAAIRSKEALLSEQARAASRAETADPANPQLQAQAKAAADAVTAFHNGPIKKFKQVWSDSGRTLQREIPLDYTTFNGMKEAYLKATNKEAPAELEPKLKQMAAAVSKTTDAERVALSNLGKEIEKQTRGKTLPTDDQIRTRLMEIMKDLPCRT